MVYVMIFCVSIGLGLQKTGALIGRIVTDKDQVDSAFSIRYTLVNTGAFIGTFLVGILYKDVFAKNGVLGFAPCFKLAAVSMWLGALWFFVLGNRFMGEVGKKPFKFEKTAEELEREKAEKAAHKEEAKDEPLTKVEKNRCYIPCSWILSNILDILELSISTSLLLLDRKHELGCCRIRSSNYLVRRCKLNILCNLRTSYGYVMEKTCC